MTKKTGYAMKLLIAVLLSLVTTISNSAVDDFNYGPLADNQGILLNDVNFIDGKFYASDFLLPSSGLYFNRQSRNATVDPVATTVERMQMIARLTNAIFLQQSLVNGTIDFESFASELLYFGSFAPADIKAIDEKAVEEVLKSLEELPGKVENSVGVQRVEAFFGNVDNILKQMPDVTTVATWDQQATFKTDLEKLEAGTLDAAISSIITDVGGSTAAFRVLQTKIAQNAVDKNHIGDLKDGVNTLLKIREELNKGISVPFKFTGKKSAEDSFSYMVQVTKGVDALKKSVAQLNKNDEDFDELSANIQKINTVVNGVNASTATLKKVRDIAVSHIKEVRPTPIKFTFGLPRGITDINQVSAQFSNPWLKNVIKDGRLQNSFSSLKSLRTSFNSLNEVTNDRISSISHVFDFAQDLIANFATFSIENAKKVDGCMTLSMEPHDPKAINGLADSAKQIDTELSEFSKALEALKKELSDGVGIVTDVITICDRVKDAATLKTALDELSQPDLKGKFGTFMTELSNKNAISTSHIVKLQGYAKSLLATLDKKITDYQKSIAPYSAILDCFLGNQYTTEVNKVVKESQRIRDLQKNANHKNTISNARHLVKAVTGTKSDLKELDTSIKSAKGFSSVESNLLNKLQNAKRHAEALGLSATAMGSMTLVLPSKSKLEVIKDGIDTLTTALAGLTQKQLDSPELKNLPSLLKMGPSLDAMFTQLETWNTDVKALTMKNLTDYGLAFAKSKSVTGINEDLGAMVKGLETLIPMVDPAKQTELRNMKDALEMLDGMGVQFGSISKSFDDAKTSLTDLDMFFSNFQSGVSATPSTPTQQNGNGGRSSNAANGALDGYGPREEKKWLQKWYIIPVVAVFVIGFISFIGFLSWKFYKKRHPSPITSKFQRSGKPFQSFRVDKTNVSDYVRAFKKELAKFTLNNTILVPGEDDKGKPIDVELRIKPDHLFKIERTDKDGVKIEVTQEEQDIAKAAFNAHFQTIFIAWCKAKFDFVENECPEGKQGSVVDDEKVCPMVKNNKAELWQTVDLAVNTRVILPTDDKLIKFKTDFYHGNYVEMQNNLLLVVMQAPQFEREGKLSTVEKFWFLVHKEKFNAVLMLCQLEEGGKTKSAEYFPTTLEKVVKFGPFEIKCIGMIQDVGIVQRTLVLNVDKHPPHTLTHFQYTDWPDHSVPRSAAALIRCWKLMRECPQGGIVHCHAGIGRSGTMAFLEELYQAVYFHQGKFSHVILLAKLRGKRARSIQYWYQFVFSIYALLEFLFDDIYKDLSNTDEDKIFMDMMRATWNAVYDSLGNDNAPEEDQKNKDKKKKKK